MVIEDDIADKVNWKIIMKIESFGLHIFKGFIWFWKKNQVEKSTNSIENCIYYLENGDLEKAFNESKIAFKNSGFF